MNGEQKLCRMCKKEELEIVLDLGMHPPSDAFINESQLNDKTDLYPLQLCICKSCGLSQLSYVVPPEILYKQEYPYESSTTETGKKHYFDFAGSVIDRFKLTDKDLVVDIGSNVGVLLEGFKNLGTKILGIDPAQNIVKIANDRGIKTYCQFFNSAVATEVEKLDGKASVITGTNVFAHVDDLHDFMKAVDILLKDDGVFVFESPSMLGLIKNQAYSSLYHEHLTYLSLRPVMKFCESLGFEVFHVENQDIHEGSFRVMICRKGKKVIETSVFNYLKDEAEAKLHELETMYKFKDNALESIKGINELVAKLKSEGKKIAFLSAPAKGMTLANACNFSARDIDFATEKSKLKIGKYTPGANIPVVADEELLNRMPDYAILLAWNFAKEIIKNNEEYLLKGGKIIVPFPEVRILEYEVHGA